MDFAARGTGIRGYMFVRVVSERTLVRNGRRSCEGNPVSGGKKSLGNAGGMLTKTTGYESPGLARSRWGKLKQRPSEEGWYTLASELPAVRKNYGRKVKKIKEEIRV